MCRRLNKTVLVVGISSAHGRRAQYP